MFHDVCVLVRTICLCVQTLDTLQITNGTLHGFSLSRYMFHDMFVH